MKKWLLPITLAGSAALLAACNTDEETVTDTSGQADTNQEEEGNTDSSDPTISFLEFDMDADYEGNENDFEVSYDNDENIEASYEDQRNKMTLSGDDAYDEIEPILSNLDITADTPDEEVIQTVIDSFKVEDGYQKLEIDITFEDGTEKEYNQE